MQITAKFGTLRNEVDWTVYPAHKDGRIVIQSAHYIALFHNDGSRKALLSKRQPGGAYFVHLSPLAGAKLVDIPQDVIDAAVAAQPQSGDKIEGVITIMVGE